MIQIDIPMPESCRDCPFEMYYMNCGETRCRASNMVLAYGYKTIPFEGRHPDCPLIEVVKCEDCEYYKARQGNLPWNNSRRYCNRSVVLGMKPNDFCSRGIRREE